MNNKNIVLIGMPGAGKSTIGIILAKVLSFNFIDSDVYIQAQKGRSLQEIINTKGMDYFCSLEERCVLSLSCESSVIATGGSVIYSDKAMRHLKASGVAVYLYVPLYMIKKRLSNFCSRGVVIKPGQSLTDLYYEREPFYKAYADITIDCTHRSHEDVIEAIASNTLAIKSLQQ
ncbi:MAG: shikimate kinase [bacterium]